MKKLSSIFLAHKLFNTLKTLLVLGLLLPSSVSNGQDVSVLREDYEPVKPNDYKGKVLLLVPVFNPNDYNERGVYYEFGYLHKKSGLSLVLLKKDKGPKEAEIDKVLTESKDDDKIYEIRFWRGIELVQVKRNGYNEFFSKKGQFIAKLSGDINSIVPFIDPIWSFKKDDNVVFVNDNGKTVFMQPENTIIDKDKYSNNILIYQDITSERWGVFDLVKEKTVVKPTYRKEELSYVNNIMVSNVSMQYEDNVILIRKKKYTIGKDELPLSIEKNKEYKITEYIQYYNGTGIGFVKHPEKELFAVYDEKNDTLILDFQFTEYKRAKGIDKRMVGSQDFYAITETTNLSAFQLRNSADKWGYIDNQNNYIPCKYEENCVRDKNCYAQQNSVAYSFWTHGKACVRNPDNGKYGVVDIKNIELIPCIYDEIRFDYNYQNNVNTYAQRLAGGGFYGTQNHFYVVKQNGKYGIVSKGNKIFVPIEYDNLEKGVTEEDFIFKKNGKYGIVNIYNRVQPAQYDDLMFLYGDKCYIAQKGNKYGIVSNRGILLPIEYDNISKYKSEYSDRWKNNFYVYTNSIEKGIFQMGLGNFPNYTTAGESYGWLYVCNDKECKIYDNKANFQTTVGDGYQALKYIESNSYEGRKYLNRQDARRESADRERQEEARKQAKQTEDAVEREKRKSTPCVCNSCNGSGHYITKTSHTETKYVPTYDKNGASTGSKLVSVEVPDERKVPCGSCKGTGKCSQ